MGELGASNLGVGAGPFLGWVPRGPLLGSALLARPRRARCLGPSPLSSLSLAPRADSAEAWRPFLGGCSPVRTAGTSLLSGFLRALGTPRELAIVAKDDTEETLAAPLP